MKKTKAKHLKSKRKIKFTERFYALITFLLGGITIPIVASLNDGDITANIFIIIFGLFAYISTFKEDE